MRQMLKKLADIGAKYNCAMVLIGHMNKASGEKNLYRGLGSIDIAAIARSILMIARDKDDPSIRYMFPVKSSLAPEGTSIAFSFDPVFGLKWIGKCQIDQAQLAYSDIGDNKKTLVSFQLGQMEDLIGNQLGDAGNNFLRLGRGLIINQDFVYSIDVTRQRLVLSDCNGCYHELSASREVLTKLKAYIDVMVRNG